MDNSISLVKISKGHYFPSHFFYSESHLLKLINIFPSKVFLTVKINRQDRGNLFLFQEEFFNSLITFLSTRINSIYSYYIMSHISSDGTFNNKICITEHGNREFLPIRYLNETYVIIIFFGEEKDREIFLSEWCLLRKLAD